MTGLDNLKHTSEAKVELSNHVITDYRDKIISAQKQTIIVEGQTDAYKLCLETVKTQYQKLIFELQDNPANIHDIIKTNMEELFASIRTSLVSSENAKLSLNTKINTLNECIKFIGNIQENEQDKLETLNVMDSEYINDKGEFTGPPYRRPPGVRPFNYIEERKRSSE